jgi:hypothetical protein
MNMMDQVDESVDDDKVKIIQDMKESDIHVDELNKNKRK